MSENKNDRNNNGRNKKVLSINSSPKMENSNSAMIMNPFLEGMIQEGALVDQFWSYRLNINSCRGDGNCWFRTPGECFQNDDMKILIAKIKESDIIVLSGPIYCDGMNGAMKNIIDRTVPLAEPFFELVDGRYRHVLRENVGNKKMVLISTCGQWELDNFDIIVDNMKRYCHKIGAGLFCLLRPHADAMKPFIEMGCDIDDIFSSAKDAGRELITDGKISEGLLKNVSRELLPREDYIESANEQFRQMLGQ